jgi:hypothetical protein
MSSVRVSRLLAAGIALAVLVLSGCGGKLARITGQVVDNGEAVRLAEGETVQIDFSTADNAYPPLALAAYARSDGSFVVDMNDGTGRGLTPGKYKVRLNGEGASLKRKVNTRLFKESVTIEAALNRPVRLTIDLSSGAITREARPTAAPLRAGVGPGTARVMAGRAKPGCAVGAPAGRLPESRLGSAAQQ